MRQLGFTLLERRPLTALGLSVLRFRTPMGFDSSRGLALLTQEMPELAADVDTLYQPYRAQAAATSGTGGVTLPPTDYAQRMIAWRAGPNCGRGFRVGMIDSAIAADAALPTQNLRRRAFGAGPEPDAGHGTAVAALLIGGRDPARPSWSGLVPDADLYAASVFEQHDGRTVASAVAIAAAIEWLVANHVPVVNVSLSGEANLLLALAAERAAQRGTILVAAAGNSGPTGPPAYPAAYPDVIAVTAVDERGQVFAGANQGDYIDFAAPGVRVWAPGKGPFGQYLTGTSFAVPFATAILSMEVATGTRPTLDAMRGRLASNSVHLGPPGKNPIYGYGLVKAETACSAATVAQGSTAAPTIPLTLP